MKRPTKNRMKRIILASLLPPLLGFLLFPFVAATLEGNLIDAFTNLRLLISPPLIIFAYIFMGIPSLIYALLMEFWLNPQTKNNFLAVLYSALLGLLAGVIFSDNTLSVVGLIVGLLVGIYIRKLYLSNTSD